MHPSPDPSQDLASDDRLDSLLAHAMPATVASTADLRHELVLMAEHAGTVPRRRLGLVAGGVVGILGIGTAASAAGLLPGWQLLPTQGGQTCEVAVVASEREASPARFSESEQQRTLREAQRYLMTLDYDAVDRVEAIAAFQREEDIVIASQPDPAERQPRLTGDDLEVSAVFRAVTDDLAGHLASQGLNVEAIEVGWLADGCDL